MGLHIGVQDLFFVRAKCEFYFEISVIKQYVDTVPYFKAYLLLHLTICSPVLRSCDRAS